MRVGVLVTLAAIVLGGCSVGGGGGAEVEAGDLSKVVLQPADLPRVFIRFDEGRQGAVDVQTRYPDGVDGFGREGGWKARFRRPGTNRTPGPLVVASHVDVFESVDGASDALAALAGASRRDGLEWSELEPPSLGDEAVAKTTVQPAFPRRVRSFLLGWRQDNAVATVEVNGFDGRLRLADAVAVAQKQANRLADAAR